MNPEKHEAWSGGNFPASPATTTNNAAPSPRSLPDFTGGTFFDHRLDLREPAGSALTRLAMDNIERIESRKRQLKERDRTNRESLVRNILANCLYCHHHRNPSRVAYWRKADRYRSAPDWLSGVAIGRTIDLMERVGLVQSVVGYRGQCSTFDATEALLSLAESCGVSEADLTRTLPRADLVRLYTPRERRWFGEDAGHDRVPFEPTDQTDLWIAQLEAVNSFLGRQKLGVLEESREWQLWLERLNDPQQRKGMPYSRAETVQTDLFRSFNNGSFEEGGRLYGGWWINAPSLVRRWITINGQPTVELDYSGHHIRILYHRKGLEPVGDLYRLEQISDFERQKGEPEGTYRPGVKALTQALINCQPGGRPWQAILRRGEEIPACFTKGQVIDMIKERHHAIADSFQTGAGLRLQRWDSDLALEIAMALMEQDIPSLPIHDSFIVTANKENRLMHTMRDIYHQRMGLRPVVKRKEWQDGE